MNGWRTLAILCSLMLAACTQERQFAPASRAAAQAGSRPDAVVLTSEGRLLPIQTTPPGIVGEPLAISGIAGRLVAIDVRPRTGDLYGLSERSVLYRIDVENGTARGVALRQRFDAKAATIGDFDPVVDKFRIIQSPKVNWSASLATGAVTVGRPLRNGRAAARQFGDPRIVGAAYTNSIPHARTTALYTIDAKGIPALNHQAPPNGGTQERKGPLGIELGPTTAFDIRSTGADDTAILLTNRMLYAVDLRSGRAVPLGAVQGLEDDPVDLALLPVP